MFKRVEADCIDKDMMAKLMETGAVNITADNAIIYNANNEVINEIFKNK